MHKLLQTAHLFYDGVSGPHMQMIRVAQLYLRADSGKIHRGNRSLDGGNRPHIHEDRRLHGSVDCHQFSALRHSVAVQHSIHSQLTFIDIAIFVCAFV